MKKPRVLLVDDEEAFARNISKLLRIRGYHVQTADSGPRALEVLLEEPVDVVVIDLKMPEMDGLETIGKIHKYKKRPKIIVLTGYPSLLTRLQANQLGVSGYLSKPCRVQDVTAALQKALSGPPAGDA
jgi:two-component system OmpR family response regulator